ncbi:MAG TPA: hypothetical protein VGZ29_13990 [Terriglobia bacterium]|nr:hypothetical protein [Terriglobia bacterium]
MSDISAPLTSWLNLVIARALPVCDPLKIAPFLAALSANRLGPTNPEAAPPLA